MVLRWPATRLIERAIEGRPGIARLAVSLDRPVVGLGASAGLHYAGLPKLLGADCITPDDADVANALGAVVGHVRVTAAARVSQPQEGLFRLNSDDGIRDFHNEADALARGRRRRAQARRRAGCHCRRKRSGDHRRAGYPDIDDRGPAPVHRGGRGCNCQRPAGDCKLKLLSLPQSVIYSSQMIEVRRTAEFKDWLAGNP